MPKTYNGFPLHSTLYQGLDWGQQQEAMPRREIPGGQQAGPQFGAKGIGLQPPGGGPPGDNAGPVGPTFGENGQTGFGNAVEAGLDATLGQLSDPAKGIAAATSVGMGNPLGILGIIAKGMAQESSESESDDKGFMESVLGIFGLGGDDGNAPAIGDPTVGLDAPPSIGPGVSPNVGNMGQGHGGTGVPSGIGPTGNEGADDASVGGGGPGIGGTGAPGGAPGAAPGSPGDAVGGAGMGGPGVY